MTTEKPTANTVRQAARYVLWNAGKATETLHSAATEKSTDQTEKYAILQKPTIRTARTARLTAKISSADAETELKTATKSATTVKPAQIRTEIQNALTAKQAAKSAQLTAKKRQEQRLHTAATAVSTHQTVKHATTARKTENTLRPQRQSLTHTATATAKDAVKAVSAVTETCSARTATVLMTAPLRKVRTKPATKGQTTVKPPVLTAKQAALSARPHAHRRPEPKFHTAATEKSTAATTKSATKPIRA